jgi:N-acetylglutamate synthase-like GNAT family acetyltransferase
MKIRVYNSADYNSVLQLFRSNTPQFFDPSEENSLIDYLQNEIEDYFVVEVDDEVIGSGGINYFLENRTARISWDIVRSDQQGKGVGSKLMQYRIDRLYLNKQIENIVVRTSQVAVEFYQKMGFKLVRIEKDFWATGFDLYQMELKK